MKKSEASSAILYKSLWVFLLFVVSILYINQEVLYTAHDRSEFLYGTPFFHTLMSKPFGLMQYVGAWLTQLCYHPALGSSVLVAIWTLIFIVGIKAFRLQGGAAAWLLLPVACLLTSVVDLGYWVYILPIKGYWFSQSVGYLIMLLLLRAARATPRKWHPAWYLLAFCLYPLIGWFALLFILCLALSEKTTLSEFIALFLLIYAAYFWHAQAYSHLKFDDVMLAGFPRFETPSDSANHLAIPFWVLSVFSVLLPLIGRLEDWSFGKWGDGAFRRLGDGALGCKVVPVVCAVAGIVFTCTQMFYDKNYIDEMRMVHYASDDNWKAVLTMAEHSKRPTNTMFFLKNVALMNDGTLLDRSFLMGNDGVRIGNSDSLHVGLLNIVAPLVYYNYGMMNEAIRLCYENAIQTGFSPFYLKILSRCALATGDEKLLERFTTLLHHHPFYSHWQPAVVTAKVGELQHAYADEITGVENSDSYIVNSISLWYNSNSKTASEQALLYSMLRCDSGRFWASLRQYVKLHPNEKFPLHAQEAYIMYMDKAPEEKRMMLPVEQTVYDRYRQFWAEMEKLVKPGVTLNLVGEQMREEWGGTYWWYNVFGNKPVDVPLRTDNEFHG